ncbi:MAG: GGDEF domain-containing protein [Solirubrobacteraceae bacterium]|nr:GGDEF domain-containing protein [Solirubrobacteraceae bacterium]
MLLRSATTAPRPAASMAQTPEAIRLRDAARWRRISMWAAIACGAGLLFLAVVPGLSANDHRAALNGVVACALLTLAAWRTHTHPTTIEVIALALGAIAIISGLIATFERTGGLPFFIVLPALAGAYLLPTRQSVALGVVALVALGGALALRPGGWDALIWAQTALVLIALTTLTRALRHGRDLLIHDLERVASTDGLTGLANRGTFEEVAGRLIERTRIDGGTLALVMFDIDHFKALNDREGHAAGDAALTGFATLLSTASRPTDLVARIGGEEFVAVMPGLAVDGAQAFAGRVGELLRDQATTGSRLTVSAGVAVFDGGDGDVHSLLSDADRALYTAKSAGRDRVAVAEPITTAGINGL